MNRLAPIVLFVYNRPELALKTLECLAKNREAENSILYIYSDGPKAGAGESHQGKIEQVRKVIRSKQWCKEINIIESEKNKGLANSIMDGVTSVVNDHGKIIVMEDDLITSPYFLKFMNEALDYYESEEKVISIHGYLYPVIGKLPETFFLKGADCWGWATWKRGWDLFEKDGSRLLKELRDKKMEYEFDYNGSYPYSKMLEDQIAGKNDSWAIRWNASAFLKNKLTLYPGRSLTQNIGTEGDGTHMSKTELYNTEISQTPVQVEKIPVEPNEYAFKLFRVYFLSIQLNIFQRIVNRLLWKKR